MSEPAAREWRLYIDDMIRFAEKALTYTQGLALDSFVSNTIVYDATLRNLELIGEAATRIRDEVRNRYGTVPWRLIIATRNRLIHGYLGIDDDTIWSIIQTDLPSLIKQLRDIKAAESGA